MNTLCFFNNKGGVGKTTLACNVASYIATERSLNVLFLDADPQCNASQLVLTEMEIEHLYRRHSRSVRRPSRKHHAVTLFDILQPIAAGEPTVNDDVEPCIGISHRFGFDLIPGHPEVALLEDKLSQSWLAFGGGDLGGARVTNWMTQLRQSISQHYDLMIIDVGPSLGALNRTVLVGSDYFITPMGCDIFSLMGLSNIGGWAGQWLTAYDDAVAKCQRTWEVADYPIVPSGKNIARFLGYTVQQYITKSKLGTRRATKAYESILSRIPESVIDNLGPFLAAKIDKDAIRLPDIPHMFSLVPLAQSANAPIHALENSDGIVGTQYSQRDDYAKFIAKLSDAVLLNLAATK